jgi:tetratricopeptide (TPR) repeat protein
MLYVNTGGDLSLALEGIIKSTKHQTEMSRTGYLYTQFGVLLKYIRLLLLPYGQTLDHYIPVENVFMSTRVLVPLIGHVLIVGTAGYMYIKSMQGRLDPAFKVVAFGVAWFYIASSLESGLIPITDIIYEHRVYLPGIGLIVSAIILSTMGLITFRSEKVTGWLIVLCLAATIVYLPLTVIRNRVWQSTISLWTDAVSKSPQKPRARINLGVELQSAGLHEKAIEQFNIAIKLDPSRDIPYMGLSRSYSALGEEDLASKYSEIAKALAFEPVDYYLERGGRFLDKGMYDKALQEFLSAYEYSPDNAAVLFNLGLFYSKKGMYDKALPYLTKTRILNPDNMKTYDLLAEIYQRVGKPSLARETYISGLNIEPLNSTLHGKFGNFLGMAAEYDLALKHLAKAIELDPDNIEARLGLGNVMFATGNLEAAISSFIKMLDLKPDNSQAHYNLSVIYAKLGRQEESEKHMNTYLTLTGRR